MRCGFLPLGDTGKDKAWLVVARPYIWINAEMIERGVANVIDESKKAWASEFYKYEERTIGKDLPWTDTAKDALQAVLTDVLKNPALKGVRDFYGTAGSNTLALDNGGRVSWPKGFKPDANGYELVTSKPDPFAKHPRVLGLRLGEFDPELNQRAPDEWPVEISVFNAGGSANGAIIGQGQLTYSLRRVDKRWVVRLEPYSEP